MLWNSRQPRPKPRLSHTALRWNLFTDPRKGFSLFCCCSFTLINSRQVPEKLFSHKVHGAIAPPTQTSERRKRREKCFVGFRLSALRWIVFLFISWISLFDSTFLLFFSRVTCWVRPATLFFRNRAGVLVRKWMNKWISRWGQQERREAGQATHNQAFDSTDHVNLRRPPAFSPNMPDGCVLLRHLH